MEASGVLDVLVVEDDPPTRDLYVRILSDAGFAPRAAHNGLQALDLWRQRRPAIILTDLRVPGLDGYGFARELHAELGAATPPIIAITGYVPADDDPRVQSAHFERLLIKPVMPALLVEALREALRMGTVTNQPGHDPKQGNKREPGSPQQADYGSHKDHEEKKAQPSSGAGGASGKGSSETA